MRLCSTIFSTPLKPSSALRVPRRPCAQRLAASLPGVPDYAEPWKRRQPRPTDPTLADDSVATGRRAPPGRKWWDYDAPTGAVGRPDIQQKAVSLPELGPGGGSGSGGGSSGGSGGGGSSGGNGGNGGSRGNGGGGGNPMRGPTYLFAAFLMAGGLAAFFRRGSYKSLMFSAAAAILLLVAASLMHHRSGILLAMGTTLVLAGVMGQRANSSRKVFPAGVVALASALMTIGYARVLV